jgi:membrane-associated phospholipid phosphatase
MYSLVLMAFVTAGPVPGQILQSPTAGMRAFYLVPGVTERAPDGEVDDVVLGWNDVALAAISAERTPPPVAARNLAMLHVAMFDAVNAVRRSHQSFLVDVVAPVETSDEAAAAVAAERVLRKLYPKQAEAFEQLLKESLARVPENAAKERGIGVGKYTAQKTLEWCEGDGVGKKGAYTPKEGPGWWRPTPPDFQAAMLPAWSRVLCFTMRRADQFRPAQAPGLQSEEYLKAVAEVKSLGGASSRQRTAEQTEIAKFWADGAGTVTPPGHWNRIAATVSRKRGLSVAENARLFALLNLALADAGIACWDSKYHYNYWRPVQAIREADSGADREWLPLLPTPPFPSYASGHSTFSGAAATVLADYFGTDEVAFKSTSDGLPGVERSYTGFWAAAQEAGRSRIYGGIHYEFDNAAGLSMGRDLGHFVATRFLRPREANRSSAFSPPGSSR